MLSYVIRRLLLLVPTLLGTTVVVFLTMGLSPGGVGGPLMDATTGNMKAEEARAVREYMDKRYGLSKPLYVQYLRWLDHISPVGFESNPDQTLGRWRWLKWPDLGTSFSKGRPVVDLVEERLPVTLLLNVLSLPLTYLLAISAGLASARRRGGIIDVTSGWLFLVLWSVPVILGGVLMIGFLANRNYIHVFPTGGLHDTLAGEMPFLPGRGPDRQFTRGYLLDTAWHLVLPVACLSYGGLAVLSRVTRGTVLDNLAADYARTAKAKGLTDGTVLFRHVFRNSLLPLITMGAGVIPGLLGGSLVIESIFSIQGMGLLFIDAVNTRDRELILDQTLVFGVIGLLSYLLTDVLYTVADPRVSFE